MDGKSVALLCIEFIEIYRKLFIREHRGEKALDEDVATIGSASLTSDTEDPLPPSVQTFLAQKWPPLLLTIIHVFWFIWMHTFMLILPGRLPHTSSPQQVQAQAATEEPAPLWTSGLLHYQLSEEQTRKLTERAKREGATIGTLLYATAMHVTAKTLFDQGIANQSTSLWGILVITARIFGCMCICNGIIRR